MQRSQQGQTTLNMGSNDLHVVAQPGLSCNQALQQSVLKTPPVYIANHAVLHQNAKNTRQKA
jgi:hypothetical protein